MNWTEQNLRDYIKRRLKHEEVARKKVRHAKNHTAPEGLPAAKPESHSGKTLVNSASRETPRSSRAPRRAKITFIVRSLRPCDWDNWQIKFLQDCFVAAGILDGDNWKILSGHVISEKAASKEDESTTVIIEQL